MCLIGDYYVSEYKAIGYDECPIRLIDLNTQEETIITTVFNDLDTSEFETDHSASRVDPHVVWIRDF